MRISASFRRSFGALKRSFSCFCCPKAFTTREPVKLSLTRLFTARSARWRLPNKLHNFGFNFTLIKTNSGSRIQATSAICQFKRNITVNVARMVKPCTNMYGNPSKKKSVTRFASLNTRVISPPVCLLVKNPSDNLPILENTSCFMSRTVAATTCAIKVPCTNWTPCCTSFDNTITSTSIKRAKPYLPISLCETFPGRISSYNTVPLK